MARVGVLALQGAFARHLTALAEAGHHPVVVRAAADFAGLAGLVLPGGESTTQWRLLARHGLDAPLRRLIAEGRPVLGTCAGLILLARKVTHPEQDSLAALDVEVARNAWGRQVHSFEAVADDGRTPLVFIRAPRITAVGPGAEVLLRYRGEPVLVRQANRVGACFHPELTADHSLHAALFS